MIVRDYDPRRRRELDLGAVLLMLLSAGVLVAQIAARLVPAFCG